jgi:NADPH:quinone reductase-like Zn-dependent oxidoreductase
MVAMATRVQAAGYGGPENLEFVEFDLPAPGPSEVAVAIKAAGVNPFDVKQYNGTFGSNPARLPIQLGGEASGIVTAVGPDVAFAVGDEVVIYPGTGFYASDVIVPAQVVLPKPKTLSFEQAGGVLFAAATAADEVASVGITAADTVLVHGASGAVGSAAVQLAVASGARVVGTAGPGNQEYVASLGATPILYGDGLADRAREAAPSGYTAAVDTAGTDEAISSSLELVPNRKRIVSAVAQVQNQGMVRVGGPGSQKARNEARAGLLALAADGSLTVRIARTYPLAETAQAHRDLMTGHPAGKFMLLP